MKGDRRGGAAARADFLRVASLGLLVAAAYVASAFWLPVRITADELWGELVGGWRELRRARRFARRGHLRAALIHYDRARVLACTHAVARAATVEAAEVRGRMEREEQ